MANIRKCIMCGTRYEYCIHCGENKPEEPWRYIYHDETCMTIAHAWRACKGNEISKKDFIDTLNRYPDHRDMILNNDSVISMGIKNVYNVKEEMPKDQIHVEKPIKEDVVVKEDKHVQPKTVKVTRNRKK